MKLRSNCHPTLEILKHKLWLKSPKARYNLRRATRMKVTKEQKKIIVNTLPLYRKVRLVSTTYWSMRASGKLLWLKEKADTWG